MAQQGFAVIILQNAVIAPMYRGSSDIVGVLAGLEAATEDTIKDFIQVQPKKWYA